MTIPPEPVCGKGTFNGAAAQAAKYQFAPCVKHVGHSGPCDSGPEVPVVTE